MILSALKKSIFMILISKDSSKIVFYWTEFPLCWIILNKFCRMWVRDALLNVVQSRDQTWLFPLRTQVLIFSVLRIFALFCSLYSSSVLPSLCFLIIQVCSNVTSSERLFLRTLAKITSIPIIPYSIMLFYFLYCRDNYMM